jgi:ParB family chromosome partitioning protein
VSVTQSQEHRSQSVTGKTKAQKEPITLENDMKATVTPQTAAIAALVDMPVSRQSVFVPLNKLVLAPDQVRQTPPTKSGIEEMAAMLLDQGQLSALQVTKDPESDRYFVHAGGRRLRGFQLLASTAKILPDFPVECKEVDALDATAVGLMENISQETMHPADAYEAFKALADQGRSIESIATQYGVAVLTVQRRLKLAGLAPELMALYRKGEIQLDHIMALVQLDDQKRQVLLWKGLPAYNRNANQIRRMIAEDEVPANDERVKLVGLKTYLAAGGGIRSDLFSEKNERFLTDPLLLEMLVGEAFEAQAADLRAQGWKWIDIQPTFSYSERNQYFNLPQKVLPESPVQKAKRVTLEAEMDALQEKHDECEDDDEIDALQEKIDAVDKQLEELAADLVDKAAHDKDIAGVVLTIDSGKIQRIENLGRAAERKQVMAEIEARRKRQASLPNGPQSDEGDSQQGGEGQGAESAANAQSAAADAIPEKLMLNLTAHRTAAIQASMLGNQKVALAALAQRFASSVFQDYRANDDALKISRTNAWHVLEKASPTVGTSRAAEIMNTERQRWEALLPQDRKTWLVWFIDQPLEVIGRKHGFSDASFYKWRSKYGGMDASEAKRLRELELENGKLKRLLAEAHLDIHALKSVFGTKR